MSEKNYYEILGVSPKATSDEIKHAYRTLARRYHPDSADGKGDQFMFQSITTAYDTLADPEKRERYDEVHALFSDREEKLKHYRKNAADFGKTSMAFDRLRSQLEAKEGKGEGLAADRYADDGKRKRKPTSEILGKVSESLQRFATSEPEREQPRAGAKVEPGSFIKRMTSSFRVNRPNESEERKIFDFDISVVESIRGTSREITVPGSEGPRLLRIRIPPGTPDGGTLKVTCPAKGNDPEQEFQVKIHLSSNDLVEREGDDLIVNIPIKLGEAIRGGEIDIPTLDGSVKVKLPPGWDISKRLRLKGRGLPTDAPAEARGSLYVRTYLVLPDRFSEKSAELAEELDKLYSKDIRNGIPKSL